jgi:hypothetical protein
MTKHLLAALFLLAPLSAAAQAPGSIGDCEKLKNDMAYNQCLASFGPKVGQRAPRVGIGQDPETSVAEAPSRGGTRVVRGRRGRQTATFTVVSGGAREVRRATVSRGRSYGTRRSYYRRRR